MKRFFTLYICSLVLFLVLDGMWLGFIASELYTTALQHLFGPVKWWAVVVFYPVFLIGLCYYATLHATTVRQALVRGSLFGFFTYLAYDFTNLATLRDWPLWISVIDIAWGTIVCGTVSAGSYFLYTRTRKHTTI